MLIHSRTREDHERHLRWVPDKLREHKLCANAAKCSIDRPQVHYLGHVLSAEGIAPDPEKISAVKDWPAPQTVTEVRSFLGLCSYYRRHVPHLASIAAPLTDLERKDHVWRWGTAEQHAFDSMKNAFVN